MATFKRINLCFDIDRLEDKKVYDLLQNKRNKTAYIIDTVLRDLEKNQPCIETEKLKEIVKDAFNELNVVVDKNNEQIDIKDSNDIPEDVFDIISNI